MVFGQGKKSKFYKYAPVKDVLLVVRNSTLKFTSPDEFNDPFDIYPYFPREGLGKMLERIRMENDDGAPRFSSREFTKMLKVADTQEFRKIIALKTAVTCFSKSALILPMWAHYADEHKGCVLEFEITYEEAVDAATSFLQQKRYKDLDLLTPYEVTYSDKRPKSYDKNGSTNSQSLSALFTKSNQWEYEQEVRCVKNSQSGIYKFPRHQLKKVIFGLNMNDKDKNEIRILVKDVMAEHGIFIDIKQIVMERETFKLFF